MSAHAESLPALHPADEELLRSVEHALSLTTGNASLLFDVRWRLKHAKGKSPEEVRMNTKARTEAVGSK